MPFRLRELEELITNLSDDDLMKMVTTERSSFNQGALDIAEKELRRRGLPEERVRDSFILPSGKTVSRFTLPPLNDYSRKSLVLIIVALAILAVILNEHQNSPQYRDKVFTEFVEDNPHLSKSDVILLQDEGERRGLSTEQGKRFGLEAFERGVKMLSESEQKDFEQIRELLRSMLSTEQTIRADTINGKVYNGELPTYEETKYLEQLNKKAFNNLPESTKSRFKFLVSKALRAGLAVQ